MLGEQSMNNHSNTLFYFTALISLYQSSLASDMISIRPKISGQLSTVRIRHEKPQALPTLNVGAGDTIFSHTENIPLNNAFLTQTFVTKNTEDLLPSLQYSFGVELGLILNQPNWPSKDFLFNPVGNIYVIAEESTRHHISGGLYRVLPKMSWGGDIGVKVSNNGNHIQLGGGILNYKSKYDAGIILGSFERLSNTEINPLDVSAMVGDDLTADQETLFPYIYTEISTEIGDIASLFIKANYSFEQSPKLSNFPGDHTHQMFPEGSAAFENNNKWRYSSVSIGISSEVSSLGIF